MFTAEREEHDDAGGRDDGARLAGGEGGEIEPREAQMGREQMGREPPLPTPPLFRLAWSREVTTADLPSLPLCQCSMTESIKKMS